MEISYGLVSFRITNNVIEFLLIRQKDKINFWCFPKGHPLPGESPKQTATREFFEELGFNPDKILDQSFIENYTYTQNNTSQNKTVIYFLAEVTKNYSIHIQASEISQAAWMNYKQALNHLIFPSSLILLKQIKSYLTNYLC